VALAPRVAPVFDAAADEAFLCDEPSADEQLARTAMSSVGIVQVRNIETDWFGYGASGRSDRGRLL
jgi:hypothetical protein